jgi:hypothetical protein
MPDGWKAELIERMQCLPPNLVQCRFAFAIQSLLTISEGGQQLVFKISI